jgi:excisionase family DNA binding protein
MKSSLAYSIAEACAQSGIGRTAIYSMINAGQLTARKRGRRTLILADDLRRCLKLLPSVKPRPDKEKKISVSQERAYERDQ